MACHSIPLLYVSQHGCDQSAMACPRGKVTSDAPGLYPVLWSCSKDIENQMESLLFEVTVTKQVCQPKTFLRPKGLNLLAGCDLP